ncbi:MAG TPA: CvpA family protein [Chthoniobacterales bacterium]
MPEASPFWQHAFLVAIFVVLGWCVWSGWRSGIVRELVAMVGMFLGVAAGIAVGCTLGVFVGRISPWHGYYLGIAVALMVMIVIYLGVAFIGALLFKRTAQQRTLLLRLVFGLGGAAIGAFVGLSIFWGALLFVRGIGAYCEADFGPHAPQGEHPGAAEFAIVKLKRSIEGGPAGRQLIAFDIMPEKGYRIFGKFGRLVAKAKVHPEVMTRLLAYPPIQSLLTDPQLAAITSDPAAIEAFRTQGSQSLLQNQKILALKNDPVLIAKVQRIDIEKALDYALEAPAPHPAAPSRPAASTMNSQ